MCEIFFIQLTNTCIKLTAHALFLFFVKCRLFATLMETKNTLILEMSATN